MISSQTNVAVNFPPDKCPQHRQKDWDIDRLALRQTLAQLLLTQISPAADVQYDLYGELCHRIAT